MTDDSRSRTVRRVLRGAGAVVAVGGLAGCESLFEDGGSAGSDAATERETDDADPTADGANTEIRSPANECGGSDTALSAEFESVEERLQAVETELRIERLRRRFLRAGRSLHPDGFEQETVDRAAATGEQVAESVVRLPTTRSDGGPFYTAGGATGWFRRPHEVVTNAHVASRLPETFEGTLRDGTSIQLRKAAVSSAPYNEPMDLALLRTEHRGTPLSTGDSAALEAGQPLLLVGHPEHVGDWVRSLGQFVYHGEALTDAGLDQTTADERGIPSPHESGFAAVVPSQGGNSGSPIVTLDGDVVGTIWFGWQSVPGTMDVPESEKPFVYDQPIAPRAHSANHHSIEAIDEWLRTNR